MCAFRKLTQRKVLHYIVNRPLHYNSVYPALDPTTVI